MYRACSNELRWYGGQRWMRSSDGFVDCLHTCTQTIYWMAKRTTLIEQCTHSLKIWMNVAKYGSFWPLCRNENQEAAYFSVFVVITRRRSWSTELYWGHLREYGSSSREVNCFLLLWCSWIKFYGNKRLSFHSLMRSRKMERQPRNDGLIKSCHGLIGCHLEFYKSRKYVVIAVRLAISDELSDTQWRPVMK